MNKFRKAIRHCKKNINESPTNNMGGIYALNPPGFRVGKKDRELKFYADVDGNFPAGVPGQEGDSFYLRPEGYWNGGSEWDETLVPNASQEFLIDDPTGKDTNDLIAEDGTVKTFLPPNSRSFILGPLVDGYVFNHGYDNYSNIGYIQKDTRQFVLLARIQGQFIDGLHPQGGRVWDGTAEQLTIYNSNFTLAMAEWFRDQLTANTFTENVPYFYSGGVPQRPQTPAECPNCPPNMFGGVTPGTGGGFGSGGNPNIGTQQGPPTAGDQDQAKVFNLTPDQQRTVMNAVMLGLDIVAVVALLFPEPATSAAGAAILGSKLRYVAKFAQAINKLNPFKGSAGLARGLRGSQVGATGLKKAGFEALKGGKNLHKGSKGLLSPGGKGVYSAPKVGQLGPGGLKPGTGGARYAKSGSNPLGGAQGAAGQPGGVVGSITPGGARGIGSIEPQKVVNPKTFQKGQQLFQKIQSGKFPRSSRANQYRQQAQKAGFGSGQTNVPASKIPKQFRKNTKTFSNSYEYETNNILLEQINKMKLLETATLLQPFSGGTDVVDGYVDKVSETSSPEELEKASDDANNIAKQDGKGLSDANLLKIDQDAEEEARRLTNFNINNPESMDADQLSASTEMIYEIDPDWLIESFGRNESLIDTVKFDKLYNEYTERRRYIGSLEYGFEISPAFESYYKSAQTLWDNFMSDVSTVPVDDALGFSWRYKGREITKGEHDTIMRWSDLFTKTWDTFNSKTVNDRTKRDREENENNYKKQSDILFRPFYIQVVREWNIRIEFSNYANTLSDDPYSLEQIPRGNATYDAASELALLGISAAVAKVFVASVGLASAATLTSILKKADGIAKWYNKGRSPGENKMSWRKLLENDWKQRGKPGSGDKGGWDPTRGFRPGVDADKGGFGSGPTPAVRQAIERPFRALMNLFQSYDLKGNLLNEETDKSLESSIDSALKETESLEDLKKVMDVLIKMMETEKNKKQKMSKESHQSPRFLKNRERENLTETRTPKQKRILREIKQPIKVKEAPTKYKMNFSGKFSAQNTPDKTASAQSDALVASGNAKGQKWRQQDKYWAGYETTERMNIIHDRVGHGKQAWDMILDEAKKKNGWRTREMQEELNKIAHERAMLKENPDYTSPFGNVEVSTTEKNDDNFNKVSKKIKQIASKDKEVKPEYPEENKMDKMKKLNDMAKKIDKDKKEYEHKKLNSGERASAYYKRLDPISADSMPDAAYPQIDDFRNKARKKSK